MKNINSEMDFLTRLMKGLALQFGKNCEVVLHDYALPYDHTIVAIENGAITGRKVGDCGTNLGLEVLRGTVQNGDKHQYVTQTKAGKLLRSTSVYLKDDEGKPIGALCINWDITDFYMCESTLRELTQPSDGQAEVQEVITTSVGDLLDSLIQDSLRFVGKPVVNMSREDKIKGLKYLDDKGAFLIKKASDKIVRFYDISKYTLYNYLEQSEER